MSFTHIEALEPDYLASDREMPDTGPQLHVTRRDDKTVMVRIVGRKGGVRAWLELSADDADRLRDYLTGGGNK